MSVPARSGSPARKPVPKPRRPTPRRRTAVIEPRRQGRPAARRRRHHLGFWLLASVTVGGLVVGLVTLNAFVAQSSFRIDDLNARVDGLSQRYLMLEKHAAHLSAPGRIAAWARRHGMSPPHDGDIHILHVPGGSQAAPARGPDASPDPQLDSSRLALKPIVEGSG